MKNYLLNWKHFESAYLHAPMKVLRGKASILLQGRGKIESDEVSLELRHKILKNRKPMRAYKGKHCALLWDAL